VAGEKQRVLRKGFLLNLSGVFLELAVNQKVGKNQQVNG
jgi:hypothetical protein